MYHYQGSRHGKNFWGAKIFFVVVVEAWLRRGGGVSGRGPELLGGPWTPRNPLWRGPCYSMIQMIKNYLAIDKHVECR